MRTAVWRPEPVVISAPAFEGKATTSRSLQRRRTFAILDGIAPAAIGPVGRTLTIWPAVLTRICLAARFFHCWLVRQTSGPCRVRLAVSVAGSRQVTESGFPSPVGSFTVGRPEYALAVGAEVLAGQAEPCPHAIRECKPLGPSRRSRAAAGARGRPCSGFGVTQAAGRVRA